MDALDFALLHALHRAPRLPYAELGAAVHLSPNAVKARIHRMQAEGVVQGFAAIPRPSLLGLSEGLLLFTGVDDLEEREEEMLRGLAEVPGVRFTDSGLDHAVHIWILYRDDADWERIERAAVSLVGKPPSRAARASDQLPPSFSLSPSTARVMRALLTDGRAHAKDLGARSGLSAKPLKRRMDTLLREGDVRIVPIISPADASGAILFRVICFLAQGATAPHIEGAIVTTEAPGVASVLAQRATLREARELQRALAKTEGVERASLQLAARRASLAWMDDALARLPVPAKAVASVPMALPRSR